MTKQQLAKKVAEEQNLNYEDLMRLSVNVLKQMDKVVPDDSELLGDSQESPSKELSVAEKTASEDASEASVDVGTGSGILELLGYHPITGDEIWK